jgi:hypothetical protein
MEIKLPKSQKPSLATRKVESLDLKLNQQLAVKVISSETSKQSLILQTLQSNKSIQVESNLAIETKPGQSLQLLVTKSTPTLEFKILSSEPELNKADSPLLPNSNKQLNLKDLVLKQIIPKAETLNTLSNSKSFSGVMPTVITAKIIAINNDSIQLKLYITPTEVSAAYTKNLKQNILQQHNPIVTLSKQQLISSETKPTNVKQPPGVEFQNFKPGQKIQLELSKESINPEFKLINNARINLVQGQIINTKVIKISNETIQLAFYKNQTNIAEAADKLTQAKTELSSNQAQFISVSAKQLYLSTVKNSLDIPFSSSVTTIQNLKPGQSVVLEVKKAGVQPEFKIIEPSQPKLNIGQVITAKVMAINNNKIQLQLPASTLYSNNKTINNAPVITLNKNQLTYSTTGNIKTALIDIQQLKANQEIRLEVVKTGIQPEFKILGNKPGSGQQISEIKILETVKQVLPIQQPVSEVVNQIIKTLPLINSNENVPDALKRLAREILESIPQVKNANDPKQLKNSINNSGLFLESKLAYSAEKNSMLIQTDFKAQLLKLQYAFKQALMVKKEQKLQSADLNLIKEMQQKTESSLARIILNQLTSLPKDEGPRQVWILDLPFLNKERSDSVKIEIDREKQSKNDKKQENWTVNITVTPPDLATIHCKISCFDKTINTHFWSDTQDVVTKITQQFDYLKQQFEMAGINPGHMTAHTGAPTSENQHKITNQSLFDQEV